MNNKDEVIFDLIIIGAGIVGLSTAYKYLLQKPNSRVLILEKESDIASHQTGRNSGVIHSGIYYKPGSLKAINCMHGYHQLIEFCNDNEVEYDLCGKLIVAKTKAEVPQLYKLFHRGRENKLSNLKILDSDQIKEREPYCSGVQGILVPQTGIIDYLKVSKKLLEVFQAMGGKCELNSEVINIKSKARFVEVVSKNNVRKASKVVVCAGIYSDKIAKNNISDLNLKLIPFKGEYYKISSPKKIVNHLIYPVPDPEFPFLGVHFTRMIDGTIECGPNAVLAPGRQAYKNKDFSIHDLFEYAAWPGFLKLSLKYWRMGLSELHRSLSKKAFVKALAELVPEVNNATLEKIEPGIRAQACNNNGELLDDFEFVSNDSVLYVLNAPSPAATSGLSIASTICKRLLS